MIIPFSRDSFQTQMKSRLSVVHLSLEFENIESTVQKVCVELSEKLGQATYEQICSGSGSEAVTVALDLLQRAVLHFAMYHHIIYTIANISNDGVTVTKSEDKTTIYKYQQDQLEEKLLQDAHFWLNCLIKHLNSHTETFSQWAASTERLNLTGLPVTIQDFERYVGVSDETFLVYSGWIVREVYREEVLSRFPKVAREEAEQLCKNAFIGCACETIVWMIEGYAEKMKQLEIREMTERDVRVLTEQTIAAVCYDVMARATSRLAFHALPSPIRIDINNEMGKNHASQADTMIREKVSRQFADKALGLWQGVDAELRKLNEGIASQYPEPRRVGEEDKFVY